MTLEAALEKFMKTPITWTQFQARAGTGYGDRTYNAGAAKTVLCRVERGWKRAMIGGQGHETLSTVQVFARPFCTDGTAFSPSLKDKITLPAAYNPQEPPILSVEPVGDDVNETNHWVILL